MQIVGAGLSKTGTRSLHKALRALGYTSLHYDTMRLNDLLMGAKPDTNFRRYDDVDAVSDLPAAWFFEELLAAYPRAKCILTLRDEDSWWRSIEEHFNRAIPMTSPRQDPFRWGVRMLAYGSARAEEAPYRKAYREHNARVQASVPAMRLLVMDVVGGQGWETLCPFLGLREPDIPFPHANKKEDFRAQVEASRARLRAGERLTMPKPRNRNGPCPCGSGLRYKRCHGRLIGAAT